jgi:DNA-binding transcriptional MerR regulator
MSPDRLIRQRHRALFSFDDVLEVSIIEGLRRRGAPVKRIRRALDYLKKQGEAYVSLFRLGAALPRELRKGALYLDVSGDDILIHRGQAQVFSAAKARGQHCFVFALVVDVAGVRRQLEEKLVEVEAVTGS